MHMADTLVSPAVGGTMWAITAGVAVYSAKKIKEESNERKAPLMGVLGAFVFAAQMINFSIPGTGSSGHFAGGMLLAILLGPYAGFITMASVLFIQALFFADGGLLALGANIFNMGFLPCFVAYPLIYKKILGEHAGKRRLFTGSIISAVIALQLGAFGVVIETLLSGITELPFSKFVLLMQPIHLAIGVVEGIVTAGVIVFVRKARPELLEPVEAFRGVSAPSTRVLSMKKVLIGLGILALICGGILSWFASTYPDGLEWSMFKVAGTEEIRPPEGRLHSAMARIQEKLSFLPDYDFKRPESPSPESPSDEELSSSEEQAWPSVSPGTTVSGLVGGGITLFLAGMIGFVLVRRLSKNGVAREGER